MYTLNSNLYLEEQKSYYKKGKYWRFSHQRNWQISS